MVNFYASVNKFCLVLRYLWVFGSLGHQVFVLSVIRPMYTPITWRMCLVPDILVKFRD